MPAPSNTTCLGRLLPLALTTYAPSSSSSSFAAAAAAAVSAPLPSAGAGSLRATGTAAAAPAPATPRAARIWSSNQRVRMAIIPTRVLRPLPAGAACARAGRSGAARRRSVCASRLGSPPTLCSAPCCPSLQSNEVTQRPSVHWHPHHERRGPPVKQKSGRQRTLARASDFFSAWAPASASASGSRMSAFSSRVSTARAAAGILFRKRQFHAWVLWCGGPLLCRQGAREPPRRQRPPPLFLPLGPAPLLAMLERANRTERHSTPALAPAIMRLENETTESKPSQRRRRARACRSATAARTPTATANRLAALLSFMLPSAPLGRCSCLLR